MALDAAAFAAHSFDYDSELLDTPLVDFLQTFYTYSDDKENPDKWAACFTEDAVMVRAAADVQGRDAISEINLGSWKGQASRQHIVYKVFPLNAKETNEVMLYGLSKYQFEDQTTGEMPWAARLHFKRFSDGKILIDLYRIYASPKPKA